MTAIVQVVFLPGQYLVTVLGRYDVELLLDYLQFKRSPSCGAGMALSSRTIHKAAFALAPTSVNIISVIRGATDRLDYSSVRPDSIPLGPFSVLTVSSESLLMNEALFAFALNGSSGPMRNNYSVQRTTGTDQPLLALGRLEPRSPSMSYRVSFYMREACSES